MAPADVSFSPRREPGPGARFPGCRLLKQSYRHHPPPESPKARPGGGA
jgi:hypothetical protein